MTVTVTVPTVAVLLAVSVKTLFVLAGLGLTDALTPLGKTEVTDRFTLPLKEFTGFTVIVLAPEAPPCTMVTLAGEGDSEKSGGGGAAFTVRLIEVV